MALNIPERMKRKLEQDSGINSFTLASVNNLKPWLDANTTVFFPEYTDHSFIHLNEVLATAESIITDESWDNITPEDVSAMIISVLLHDCAMHITEDGFYSLIRDTYPTIKSQYVSEEPNWSIMWSDYIAEAKRFNSDKLKSIFDDTKPVSDIPEDKIELTTRDKLLIGEFVRRHHARIAHEIVFNGVPGTHEKTLKLAEEPRRHFLDLCGFIAKSHNMSLRQAVDKIQYKKRRIHLNTHVPFLMSILRISDYIQVHATRAPASLLNIKSLISPISKGEWKKHDAILEISHADEDPEALFIDAEPQDALIFEDLRWLFDDIQRELDEVWAVLGEVYGRYDEMANLGINIRRLRSSLDNINEYVENKRPNFIPKVLKFRTADSEMMELLIAPLYGDKPEIGIRELLQNAVDACLERDDIVSKSNISFENPEDYDICISVIKHDNHGEVIVEDYGVGMTLDTVENYFLNIGASFRNSDRWKKAHETDGDSNINRTGRFGIGILAAYLLGNELQVETRNISQLEHEGLRFTCSRGSKAVTVENVNLHVGTKISIKTSKSVINDLVESPQEWDWFCLSKPKVQREISIKLEDSNEFSKEILTQRIQVPFSNSKIDNTSWHRVKTAGFEDILWSHENILNKQSIYNYKKLDTVLICNGIFINSGSYDSNIEFLWNSRNHYLEDYVIKPNNPTVVIYDNNGEMPLNIQRNQLTNASPSFIKQISINVTINLINSFFSSFTLCDFNTVSNTINKVMELEDLEWSVDRYGWNYIDSFVFSNKGILILEKKTISKAKPKELQIIPYQNDILIDESFIDNFLTNFSYSKSSMTSKTGRAEWLRECLFLDTYRNKYIAIKSNLLGSRCFIRISEYTEICNTKSLLPKYLQKKLKVVWEDDEWYVLENKESLKLPTLNNPKKIIQVLEKNKLVGIVYHYLNWDKQYLSKLSEDTTDKYSLSNAWLQLNNDKAYFKL